MPGWLDDIDLHNKIVVSRDTRSSIGARYLETKCNAWMVCLLDFSQKGDDDLIWSLQGRDVGFHQEIIASSLVGYIWSVT